MDIPLSRPQAAGTPVPMFRYMEAGGSFIDTANMYAVWIPGGSGGDSERILCKWMRERGNRDSVFLATKHGSARQGSGRGLRAAQLTEELDASLARLGTDHVDLYYSHFDDLDTPIEETMAAYARAIEAGKVRCIGASNFWSWRLEEVRQVSTVADLPTYCCMQARHSYLRIDPWASYGAQEPCSPEVT